jgi:cyclohexa-1,5-dienecarbonyl-CoA hydratase
MINAALIEDGTVLRIELARPKANILNSEMLAAIFETLSVHRDAQHLRMVLLRGSGGSFSYGASVEEHQREHVRKMLGRFHDTVRMIASYPVPVACAVEGRCLGGGFELILASHFVFATMNAIFACPEIKLGVIPPVLAAIGGKRMPPAVAERIMLTGEEIDASMATTFGLVTGVVADGRDVEGATLDWYRKHLRPLSAYSLRQATAASRIGLVSALDVTLREVERRYLEQLVPSHDGNEGIAAFLEKRAPVWRDA